MKSIKRTITFIIMVVMCITAFPLVSSANSKNVIESYVGVNKVIKFDKSTGEIVGGSGLKGHINIPNKIAGVPVVAIKDGAFKNEEFTSISIPSNVNKIGDSAFFECKNLVTVRDAKNITTIGNRAFNNCPKLKNFPFDAPISSIGDEAFYYCKSLESIVLSDTVTYIGEGAFKECSFLKNIDIPDSVTHIGNDAFARCFDLKTVKLPTSLTVIGEGIFKSCGLEEITLPDSIVEIGNSAFESCTKLKTVKLPSSLAAIGESSFKSCGLEEIALPDSIVEIGVSAFEACSALKTVCFSSSLKVIGECVFKSCGFESLNVPDSIVEISKSAFEECSQLKTINFSDSLKAIGENAFKKCIGLTDITIPASVENISEDSFILCDSLQSINVAENNMFYTSVDGVLFTKKVEGGNGTIGSVNEYVLISYPAMKSDVEYSIPDGIQRISDYAFSGNEFLCSVTIPASVTKIGKYAFSEDVSLESIELSKNIKEISYGMFYGCGSLKTIVIPEGVEYIYPESFVDCSSLSIIHFPRSLKEICIEIGWGENEGPFRGCRNITDVYFAGNSEKWGDLTDIYQLYSGDLSSAHWFLTESGYYLKKANVHWVNPFIDIQENDGKWFTDSVVYCYINGYLGGISGNEFDYKSSVNRAMFATILAKIDDAPLYEYSEMSFTDVPAEQWYSNAIEWAYRNGYTAGLDRGIFGRKYPVTREQLATFLYTYSEKKGYDVSDRADIGAYTDHANVSDYALEAMKWAVSKGIISGTDKRELLPKDSITRAQMAVVIKSFVENIIPVKVD